MQNSEKIRTQFKVNRSSKVIDFGAYRKRICNFLLLINSNFGRISYRFFCEIKLENSSFSSSHPCLTLPLKENLFWMKPIRQKLEAWCYWMHELWLHCYCGVWTAQHARIILTSIVFADRRPTNGRAYATVLRLSVVCTECIVAKRCVLEQKLLLIAYRKSYMRNRSVPKMNDLDLCLEVNHCVTFNVEYLGNR